MGWTGALLSGLRKGHLSLRRLAWQGPGPPAGSGNGGARGCQASWQHGGHSGNGEKVGFGKRRWLVLQQPGPAPGSALLDASCSGSVLPLHRVHPGG